MKTNKTIPILLMLLLALPAALAQVAITEIMYAPNQTASETDSEWIELYNPGPSKENLTGWKISGNGFDPAVLEPYKYLVVARELADSDDADTDSFQSVWGTSIFAVDGSFVLGNTGATVNLTDAAGVLVDSVSYTSGMGGLKNGKTIEKTESGWNESTTYGGTPGTGPIVNKTASLQDELVVTLDLENSAPQIQSASYDANKIYATVYDANGLDEVTSVYVELLDQVIDMIREATTFKAEIPKLAPGSYDATVFAKDAASISNKTITITIETIASMNLVQDALSFAGMKAGETKNATIDIQNNGNVDLQLEFAVVGEAVVQENLQCFNTNWKNMVECTIKVPAGSSQSINLRLAVPEGTKAGQYTAKLQTTATVL